MAEIFTTEPIGTSVIKKNEIMPFVAMWLEIEGIILSEVSQKEKDKYNINYIWEICIKITH